MAVFEHQLEIQRIEKTRRQSISAFFKKRYEYR